MKAKRVLDHQLKFEVICAVILVVLIVIGSYMLLNKNDNIFNSDDLIVDFNDDNVAINLYAMTDGKGLQNNPYTYTITNNSNKDVKYVIYLKGTTVSNPDNAKYIRVGLDDVDIKDLLDFRYDNGRYVLYETSICSGCSVNHVMKFWLNTNAPSSMAGINANFNFGIEGSS